MRNQVYLDDGSADHGFSHSALVAVMEYNMALADHFRVSIAASDIKSEASFNSLRGLIMSPAFIPCLRAISILDQGLVALETDFKVTAGLQAPPAT